MAVQNAAESDDQANLVALTRACRLKRQLDVWDNRFANAERMAQTSFTVGALAGVSVWLSPSHSGDSFIVFGVLAFLAGYVASGAMWLCSSLRYRLMSRLLSFSGIFATDDFVADPTARASDGVKADALLEHIVPESVRFSRGVASNARACIHWARKHGFIEAVVVGHTRAWRRTLAGKVTADYLRREFSV